MEREEEGVMQREGGEARLTVSHNDPVRQRDASAGMSKDHPKQPIVDTNHKPGRDIHPA